MHFCKKCDNMYYIKLDEDDGNSLIYYCRKCGTEDNDLIATSENICVSKSDKKEASSYHHIVNKYTKLDPTLPRIYDIKCPNDVCVSNVQKDDEKKGDDVEESKNKSDIIYLRYDDINMKFVYICTLCDTVWKSTTNN